MAKNLTLRALVALRYTEGQPRSYGFTDNSEFIGGEIETIAFRDDIDGRAYGDVVMTECMPIKGGSGEYGYVSGWLYDGAYDDGSGYRYRILI